MQDSRIIADTRVNAFQILPQGSLEDLRALRKFSFHIISSDYAIVRTSIVRIHVRSTYDPPSNIARLATRGYHLWKVEITFHTWACTPQRAIISEITLHGATNRQLLRGADNNPSIFRLIEPCALIARRFARERLQREVFELRRRWLRGRLRGLNTGNFAVFRQPGIFPVFRLQPPGCRYHRNFRAAAAIAPCRLGATNFDAALPSRGYLAVCNGSSPTARRSQVRRFGRHLPVDSPDLTTRCETVVPLLHDRGREEKAEN